MPRDKQTIQIKVKKDPVISNVNYFHIAKTQRYWLPLVQFSEFDKIVKILKILSKSNV